MTTNSTAPENTATHSTAAGIADDTIAKLFDSASDNQLLREALRLLAHGQPITIAALAAAAGQPDADLGAALAGQDIEYDEQGRIVGWVLTLNPTPHQFIVHGHRLYTWCAPDTLIFPAVIGAAAQISSPCPITGTPIRLTVDPTAGVTALDPAGAVVTIVNPNQVDPQQVRTTLCNPQHFFATTEAAAEWQTRYPGMIVLPVAQAYRHIAQPLAQATLGHTAP